MVSHYSQKKKKKKNGLPKDKPSAHDMTLKNSKLALPRESERLHLLMMVTLMWWKINGFIDVSTADSDENPDT